MKQEAEIKELEFIQNIISRLSTHSFLLKGWYISIICIALALQIKDYSIHIGSDVLILLLIGSIYFWCLDSIFLQRERAFRILWGKKIKKHDLPQPIFDFDITTHKPSYFKTMFSVTLIAFYGSPIVIVSVLTICKLT